MTVATLSGRKIVRHSRRFYLQLCGWCHRALGPAGSGATRARCRCAWRAALLRVARERLKTLGLPGELGPGGGSPPPGRPRRASRVSRRASCRAA